MSAVADLFTLQPLVSRKVRYKSLSSYLPINKNKLQPFTLLKYYIQPRSLLLLKSTASTFRYMCFLFSPLSLFPILHFQLSHTHFPDALAPTSCIFPTQPSTCCSFPCYLAFPFLFQTVVTILPLLLPADNLLSITAPVFLLTPETLTGTYGADNRLKHRLCLYFL